MIRGSRKTCPSILIMEKLRKKIPSSLLVYNIFNKISQRYFSNIFIRSAKRIKNEGTEKYINFFIATHYGNFQNFNELKRYILWLFQEKGKVHLNVLHIYIEEWKQFSSGKVSSFASEISQYMSNENLAWSEYIAISNFTYPPIIQQYVGEKNIPFEVIVYLRILDKMRGAPKNLVQTLLHKEIYNMKDHKKSVVKNKKFISNELLRLESLL